MLTPLILIIRPLDPLEYLTAMPGTDFTRVNSLKPVTERPEKDKRQSRELSPSLNSNSTMYQSLRSYVGELQDLTATGSSLTVFELKLFNLEVQLKTAKTMEEFALSSLERRNDECCCDK